jgi:hypothetical protein
MLKGSKACKFFSLVLSLSIVFSTMMISVKGDAPQLPAPVLSTSPVLSYQYSRPADNPTSPGDVFTPNLGGTPAANAPVLSGVTAQADPDSSFVIQGSNFPTTGNVWVYSQTTSGDGSFFQPNIISSDSTTATATITAGKPYGMYLTWVVNSQGNSYPVRINAANVTWISKTEAVAGSSVSLYGSNLSYQNGESVSYVYLRPWGAPSSTPSVPAQVTVANPYKVTFTLPSNLTANTDYEVWLHNGHGGQYGWSGPQKIHIDTSNPYSWNGTVHDVTAYGADRTGANDSYSAICTAINAASSGDTIYFPSGTYKISSRIYDDTKSLYFKGQDKSNTTIYNAPTFTDPYNSPLYVSAFPTKFTDLSFLDDKTSGGAPIFIMAKGDNYPVNPKGLIIDNCIFTRQSRQSLDSSLSDTVSISHVDDFTLSNCSFTVPMGPLVTGCNRVFINNNIGYGNWILSSTDGPSLFHFNFNNMMDVSNNQIYGKDKLTDASGTLVNGDQSFCRSMVFQLPGGASKDIYIADNTGDRVGDPNTNVGEEILFEDPYRFYDGTPTSVTATGLTFSSPGWTVSQLAEAAITIVNGAGEGQTRHIVSATDTAITIDKPWDINPDTGSRIMIYDAFENVAVYRNNINGCNNFIDHPNATAGIQAYGNMLNFWVVRNTFSNLMSGVRCTPHFTNLTGYSDPSNATFAVFTGTIIANNQITNVRAGIELLLSYNGNSNSGTIPMHVSFNNIIRGNTVTNSLLSTDSLLTGIGGNGISVGSEYRTYTVWQPNNCWLGDWVKNTIVENNTIHNAATAYVRMQRHQGETVIRNNTFDGSNASTDGIVYDPDAAQATVLSTNSSNPVSNLINNAGFEDDWSQWGWLAANTGQLTTTQPAGLSVSTADKHSGSKSVKIDGTAAGYGEYCGFSQDISIKPNTYYKWTYYSNLTQGRAQIAIRDLNRTNIYIPQECFQGAIEGFPYGQWVQDYNLEGWGQGYGNDNHVFYSGSNEILKLEFQFASKNGNVPVGYIDDFSLIECDVNGNLIVTNTNVNHVSNAGFEDDWSQWGWLAANTGQLTTTQPAGLSVSTADKHSGSKSVKIDGTAAGYGEYCGFYQDISIKPNTYYKWTYYSNLSQGKAQIAIRDLNRTNIYNTQECFQGAIEGFPYGQWVQDYNLEGWGQGYGNDNHVFYSGNNEILKLEFQFASKNGNVPVGYIDDFSLIECDVNGNLIN